jgi:mannose-6-phosphate isomerase-like protein (cupin superfamily)
LYNVKPINIKEKKMKISVKQLPKREIDKNLVIYDLLSKPELNFDFVIAELSGDHPALINKVSDRVYFILSGKGSVRVGDTMYSVDRQDLVFIPKGTIHSIHGKLKYIIITSPPFDPNNEEIIEP